MQKASLGWKDGNYLLTQNKVLLFVAELWSIQRLMSLDLKTEAEHYFIEVGAYSLQLSVKDHNPESNLNSRTRNKGLFSFRKYDVSG